MPVPFFDINNNFAVSHIPHYKRLPKWIQLIRGFLGTLVYTDSIFRRFMNGSDDLPFYDVLISYSKYDKVRDNFGVYESQVNANLGNTTSDEVFWVKVLDSFVSITEQSNYVCRKLQMEYYINHIFQQQLTENSFIGYKNPTSIDPGVGYLPLSDIFIEAIFPTSYSVLMWDTMQPSNTLFGEARGYYMFDTLISGTPSSYKYSVNIPLDVFNSLGSTDEIRESIVRKFVDKMNTSGTTYIIVTY